MADKQWEYRVDRLAKSTDIAWTDELNRLGGEGWELVAVIDTYIDKCVFKREKAPDYAFLNMPTLHGSDGAQRPEPASGEGS